MISYIMHGPQCLLCFFAFCFVFFVRQREMNVAEHGRVDIRVAQCIILLPVISKQALVVIHHYAALCSSVDWGLNQHFLKSAATVCRISYCVGHDSRALVLSFTVGTVVKLCGCN